MAGNSWRQVSFDLRLSFWDWTAGIDWIWITSVLACRSCRSPSRMVKRWRMAVGMVPKFRLDLDLNIWFLGVNLGNWRDFGIYLGPFNIQIETGRLR